MFNMIDQQPVHAVILTGGRSSRMGGRHKPGILVGGRSVIDRTITSLWDAAPGAEVLIAGTNDGLSPELHSRVTVVREDPPFAGPVAGVAAAVDELAGTRGVVLLLGGDLPFLSARTMTKLIETAGRGAAVVSCVDETGHLQYLCSAWRADVLRTQVADIGEPAGVPLRALFSGLEPELIDCDPNELRDIDTPEDLARAVTTSDGRPVPEMLLRALERVGTQTRRDAALVLSPQETVEILEFARAVKHVPSVANPVVAAFIAGQLAGSQDDASVEQVLGSVLDVVRNTGQLGIVQEASD